VDCAICDGICDVNSNETEPIPFEKFPICRECTSHFEEGCIKINHRSDSYFPHPNCPCPCDIFSRGGCQICSGNCHTKDSHGQVSCMFNCSMGIEMGKNDWCIECVKWQIMRGYNRKTGWFPGQWDNYDEKHEFLIFEAVIRSLYQDDGFYDASVILSDIEKEREIFVGLAIENIKSHQLGWDVPDEDCDDDGQIWSIRDDITGEPFTDYDDEIYSVIASGCGPKLALESVDKEALWIELIIRGILPPSVKFYVDDGNPADVIKCHPFEESVPQTQEETDNDETHVGFLVKSGPRSEKWKELFGESNTWDAIKMIQEGFYEEEKEHLIALGFIDPSYDKIIE